MVVVVLVSIGAVVNIDLFLLVVFEEVDVVSFLATVPFPVVVSDLEELLPD